MPTGLVALLDDVAAIAKVAAASVDDISVAAARAGTKSAAIYDRFFAGARTADDLEDHQGFVPQQAAFSVACCGAAGTICPVSDPDNPDLRRPVSLL